MNGQWDYVIAQGLFYKQWCAGDCLDILQKMWTLTRKALGVTTIINGQKDELTITAWTLLSWVRDMGCEKWTIRHDYHPNDVCLYLYK